MRFSQFSSSLVHESRVKKQQNTSKIQLLFFFEIDKSFIEESYQLRAIQFLHYYGTKTFVMLPAQSKKGTPLKLSCSLF